MSMSNDKIVEQLEKVREIVRNLCKERRCPSMSIPVNSSDEDVVIYYAINAAIAALSGDKITGWVAWHPEHGMRPFIGEKTFIEDRLHELYSGLPANRWCQDIASAIRTYEGLGWRVREVTITFNDEVKDGKD